MQSASLGLGQSVAMEGESQPTACDADADGDADADADVDSVAQLRDWAATWRPDGDADVDADGDDVALVRSSDNDREDTAAVHEHEQEQEQEQEQEHLCDCSFAEAGLTSAAERKCEFLATFTLVPPWSASQNTNENSSTALKCAKRRLLVQHSRRPVRATRLNCAKQQQQLGMSSEQRTRKLPASGELLDSDDDEQQDKMRTTKNAGARHTHNTSHSSTSTSSSRWVFNLQRTQAADAKPASGSNKFMLVYADDAKRVPVQAAPKSTGGRKGLHSRNSTWASSGSNANAKANTLEKVVPASDLKNEDELDESSVDVDIDIPTGLVINSLPDVNVKPATLSLQTKAEPAGARYQFSKIGSAAPHFSVQKAPPTPFYVPSTSKRGTSVTTCAVQPRTFRVPSKAAEMLLTTPRSAASSSAALRSRIKPPVVSNSNAHMGPVSLMKLLPNSTVN